MTPWKTAVCQRAVDTYGKDHQLIICMEEVADVEVMLEQVKLIFELREAATEAKEAKLLRLRERIVRDTGEQDYSTSMTRKWLDDHTKPALKHSD